MFNDERTSVPVKISNEKVREATQFVRINGETTIANYATSQRISEAYASQILKTAHEQGHIGLTKPAQSFGKRPPYLYTSVTAGVERDPASDDTYEPVVPVTAKTRKRPVRGAQRKVTDFLADKQVGYRFDVVRIQNGCRVSHQPVREALKPLLENGLVTKDGHKAGRQQFKKVGNFGGPAAPMAATPVADMSVEQLLAREAEIDAQVEGVLEERAAIKTRLSAIRALVLDF